MRIPAYHEPNPRRESTLRPRFFDEWSIYHEDLICPGRPYGLLPVGAGQPQTLAIMDPPGVLKLPAIHAIGAHGHLISTTSDDLDCAIPPLDTNNLPVGRYRAFACLGWDHALCGDVVQEPGNAGNPAPGRQRWLRKSRLVLAIDDGRFEHRDWLPVAELERERAGGMIRTILEPRFHPPVVSMAAWRHSNPLLLLAQRGLYAIEEPAPDSADRALRIHLRTELQLLMNIGESGTPETTFLQAQRVIGLLRGDASRSLLLDGELQNFRYSPEDFPLFLAQLAACLEQRQIAATYPATIEVDLKRYQRMAGELVQDGEFWIWTPPSPGFLVNELAIYLPWADWEKLPHIRYGRLRAEPNHFGVAIARQLDALPGVALMLDDIPRNAAELQVTADSHSLLQRLRLDLGEGHAIYYR